MDIFWLTSTFTFFFLGGSTIGALWWKSSSHLPPKSPDTCSHWFLTADAYDLKTVYWLLLPRTFILKWIHREGRGRVSPVWQKRLTPGSGAGGSASNNSFQFPMRKKHCNQTPYIKRFSCVLPVLNWLIPINFPINFASNLYPSHIFLLCSW